MKHFDERNFYPFIIIVVMLLGYFYPYVLGAIVGVIILIPVLELMAHMLVWTYNGIETLTPKYRQRKAEAEKDSYSRYSLYSDRLKWRKTSALRDKFRKYA